VEKEDLGPTLERVSRSIICSEGRGGGALVGRNDFIAEKSAGHQTFPDEEHQPE